MKKIILSALLFVAAIAVSAQSAVEKKAKKNADIQKIEATYSASNPNLLRKDIQFKGLMKKVIGRGDESSAYLISKYSIFIYMNGMKADVETSIAKMPQRIKQSEEGMKVQDSFYRARQLSEGMNVPDFTLKAADGKDINLYTFIKGKKCVVLDFWASWCHWCRMETPNVKQVYDTFHGQDFDVISVSLDKKDEAWRKAIGEDDSPWTQVIDPQGTDGSIYAWYSLNGIPAIFLLDGNGKILASNMRGEGIINNVKKYLGR